MKKVFIRLLFSFILLFSFSNFVNAECSYSERVQLLNEAEEVDIFFEVKQKDKEEYIEDPNIGETMLYKYTYDYIEMKVANISNNIFLVLNDRNSGETFEIKSSDLEQGLFVKEILDIDNAVTYEVSYRANLNNCFDYEITKDKLIKPFYNAISDYLVCGNEVVRNSKYCKKYIDIPFNMSENQIINHLNKIIEEEKVTITVPQVRDVVKKYWFIPVIVIGGVTIFGVIFIIVKKRGEL